MEKRLAVFDIDGTLFRSSLLVELVEELIEHEIFPAAARAEYADAYISWLNRQGSYEDYIDAVVSAFQSNLKGVYYGDLAEVADVVAAEHQHRVYRYTRDLIGELADAGYYLLAISQSPKRILDRFTSAFGFGKVYGRLYEIGAEDRFTGVITDEHLIANKANIVRRVLEKEGFSQKGSIGVGDTEGDIPFLEMVEQPICFNPNNALYRHARRQGWPIVVERKDVIYRFSAPCYH